MQSSATTIAFAARDKKKWWRSVKRLRSNETTPTLIENGRQFTSDVEKAKRFNFRYCHPRLDPLNLPYTPMPNMDLRAIPTVTAPIYPPNDVKSACL